MIRANCLTLVQRPGAVNAVSVSRGFAHSYEVEREAFIALAQQMAGEYGLRSEIDLRGHFLTVRFTRAEVEHADESPSAPSLLDRILMAFRRRPECEPSEEHVAVGEKHASLKDQDADLAEVRT
jgi:hypothetical protein